MAITQVHIACLFIGGSDPGGAPVDLPARVAWSQTMPAAGVTDLGAAYTEGRYGQPAFEIATAQQDIFVSIGTAPDAVNGPRVVVRANTTRELFAKVGDKLAWVIAT